MASTVGAKRPLPCRLIACLTSHIRLRLALFRRNKRTGKGLKSWLGLLVMAHLGCLEKQRDCPKAFIPSYPRHPRIIRTTRTPRITRITKMPRITQKRKSPTKDEGVPSLAHPHNLYSGKQPINDFCPSQAKLASCVSSLVALN